MIVFNPSLAAAETFKFFLNDHNEILVNCFKTYVFCSQLRQRLDYCATHALLQLHLYHLCEKNNRCGGVS